MLERKHVKESLEAFINTVVSGTRRNLRPYNVSKRLSKSVRGDVELFPNSISVDLFMEQYGVYQDAGVSGTKRKFNTPYKYTNKQPPASAFDKWQVRRGLASRNDRGQFTSRRSANFALAAHIKKMGIRPKKFFTNAFEKAFKDLPDDVIKAYGLNLEEFIRFSLNIDR